MEATQAAGPEKDNSPADEAPGQGGSVLTGKAQAAAGTPPSAGDTAPKTPPAWKAQLPDDLKGNEALDKFPVIGDLAKSYLELEGKMGKSVAVPGEGATAEEWARYHKTIGVPDNATDYKLERVKLPNTVSYDEKAETEFKDIAHKAHLTPEQANLMHLWHVKSLVGNVIANKKVEKATAEQTETQLRERWGAKYDLNTEYMKRGWNAIATPSLAAKLNASGLGNDIELIEKMVELGAKMGDKPFRTGSGEPTVERDPAKLLYPNQK